MMLFTAPMSLLFFARSRNVLRKRTVVCVSASRQHVWLGRKCTREDERHVKVPGFWRSINLPIRPEITWPDLTLPDCLRGEGEQWEDSRGRKAGRKCEALKMKPNEDETLGRGPVSEFTS